MTEERRYAILFSVVGKQIKDTNADRIGCRWIRYSLLVRKQNTCFPVSGAGSPAMHADAKQTEFCTYLSGILLAGLLFNALFGLWWADPVAGLVMVPLIAREGVEGFHKESVTVAGSVRS